MLLKNWLVVKGRTEIMSIIGRAEVLKPNQKPFWRPIKHGFYGNLDNYTVIFMLF